ncbi:MAG: hypothetical protein DMF55_05190 [Acidobacteria bacterium]|nr:MAG: hypothetical protein DMF55_05190 [Acidobacteriota bacterium]
MGGFVLPRDRGEEALTPLREESPQPARRGTDGSRRLSIATLLVFDLVLFAPLFARGRVLSSHEFVRAHHPWRQTDQGILEAENPLLADPAASGETTLVRYRDFPKGFFWNPWVSSGAIGPFHLAQGFLSPFVALPSFLLPEAWIETGILFAKFNFAYLAALYFLRSRRFSDLAAAAGAATWAFSTGQTVWGLWMQTSVSVTFPLLLSAVDRAFERERPARSLAFGSASFLLCLAGGFPHWILYGALAAGLYFVFRAAREPRSAGRAVATLALGLAISVAILTPSILASARFVRASGFQALRKGMGSAFPLPLRHIRLYFFPEYQGTTRSADYHGVGWIPGDNYVETAAGVGLVAATLAAVGLFSRRRHFLALWSAALAAAVALPLYGGGWILKEVGSLPFLDNALFSRSKILIVFAVAVLAACGMEALESLAAGSEARRIALKVAPFAIAVPLAFLALDFHTVSSPSDAVFATTPGVARLEQLERDSPGRFAAAGWTLLPNTSEVFRANDARGHLLHEAAYRRLLSAADPLSFGRYGTYLLFDPRTLDPASPVLDLLNVTVLAAPPRSSAPTGDSILTRDAAAMEPEEVPAHPTPDAARFPRIWNGPDMALFARPTAFPRFWLVSRAVPGGIEEVRRADRATLASVVFAPPEVAQALAPGEPRRSSDGAIRIVSLEPERFEIETETPLPSLLVSSQKSFPPYWRLDLDGKSAPGFEADGIFLGLELPAGRHRVEGRFRIPRWELASSGVGLLALAAVVIRGFRPGRAPLP